MLRIAMVLSGLVAFFPVEASAQTAGTEDDWVLAEPDLEDDDNATQEESVRILPNEDTAQRDDGLEGNPRGHISDRYPERSHFAIRPEVNAGTQLIGKEQTPFIPIAALHVALGADTAAGGYYGAGTLRLGYHDRLGGVMQLAVGVDTSWPIGDVFAIGLRPSAGLLGLPDTQAILLMGGAGVSLDLQGLQTKVFGLGAALEARIDYAQELGVLPGLFVCLTTQFRVPRRDDDR
jgi:hypothetical protein